MYFTADDEADEFKAQVSREMRERLGIYQNPLDGNTARVRSIFVCVYVCLSVAEAERERRFVDVEGAVHVPLLPQGRIDAIPHSGWSPRQLAPI